IIRGGTVIDGSGGAPFEADVAVSGGRIAAVGAVSGRGTEEIDAKGKIVTPGFVDVHTHYDGQVTWENTVAPSSGHGVTSVMMGNCGVGFAPCRPSEHDQLIGLMEGVEDIPGIVMREGIPWNWESFPEYFDRLAERHYDADIAGLVPHAALRVYVMGQRGLDREPSTEADRAEMARLLREAVKAGAMGFGTSRTLFHRSSDGKSIPTLSAPAEELMAMAMALKDCGRGLIQYVSDFQDREAEFRQIREYVARSGRPFTFSMGQSNTDPDSWRGMVDFLRQANADGLTIKGQALGRPVGFILGHELTLNPFYSTETYRSLAHLPFAARIATLREPEIRAKIIAEPPDPDPVNFLGRQVRGFETMFQLGDPPDYEQPLEASIASQARARGISAEALAYDLMLERDGRNQLYLAVANYANGSLSASYEMLKEADIVPGLGDGGAHYGTICDSSYSTYLLCHWARDRTRGPRLELPHVVRTLAHGTAKLMGLDDRGLVARGYKADLNVIDFDRLRLHPPEIRRDLPADGRRLVQRADGYVATIVNGVPVYRDGAATGALPGRLIRGPQPAPAA
ncbi:MAG: Amidohydrolase, partial [Rhodospirillales bacterium]|nr:Amidohydrolase [Rhodospirillales bacterium]